MPIVCNVYPFITHTQKCRKYKICFFSAKYKYIQIRNSQCIVFTIGNTKEVKSSIKIQEKRIVYLSNFFIWLIRKYIFLTKSLRSSLLDNAPKYLDGCVIQKRWFPTPIIATILIQASAMPRSRMEQPLKVGLLPLIST